MHIRDVFKQRNMLEHYLKAGKARSNFVPQKMPSDPSPDVPKRLLGPLPDVKMLKTAIFELLLTSGEGSEGIFKAQNCL